VTGADILRLLDAPADVESEIRLGGSGLFLVVHVAPYGVWRVELFERASRGRRPRLVAAADVRGVTTSEAAYAAADLRLPIASIPAGVLS